MKNDFITSSVNPNSYYTYNDINGNHIPYDFKILFITKVAFSSK